MQHPDFELYDSTRTYAWQYGRALRSAAQHRTSAHG